MVRHASLWTLRAVDGVVKMVTERNGVGRLGKKRDDTHDHAHDDDEDDDLGPTETDTRYVREQTNDSLDHPDQHNHHHGMWRCGAVLTGPAMRYRS